MAQELTEGLGEFLMERPEQDINDRTPLWDCMQSLFMDTDVTLSYARISKVTAQSKYSLEELEQILFNEVLPALKFNMFDFPASEWAGFQTEWVVERVLKKHRFGKWRPWVLRSYTKRHWAELVPLIKEARKNT